MVFQTRGEISDQEQNIADMEMAIKAKENPLKLAETRLENRTFRPHVELCRDDPQDGLTMEVQALKDTLHQLNVKLDHSRQVQPSPAGAIQIISVWKVEIIFII